MKFHKGDKIRVYGNTDIVHKGTNSEYVYYLRGQKGVVISNWDDELSVDLNGPLMNGESVITVHAKQCRKRKRKCR